MSEVETVIPETVIEEIPAAPVATALPELRYTYQPKDDAGRPMGGAQVLKYTTQEELIEKMQEQNTLLMRKLRSETRKNRLGISDEEVIPAESQRFQSPVEFNAKELTPDQRVKLSRDLLDPERFSEATDTFFESTLGVTPEALRSTLRAQQEAILVLQAKQETDAFLQSNPGYFKCQENYEAITNWMVKNNLAPVRDNFQAAHDELHRAGILIEGEPTPIALVPQPTPPIPEPEVVAVVEEAPKPVSRIASGLTRGQAADAGIPVKAGDDIVYEVVARGVPNKVLRGMAAVNAMPSDEYKRRLITDPNFSKKIDKLEQQQATLRTARRQELYSNQ